MRLDALPINLFDLVLVAVLLLGLFHGRKQGLSGELLSLLAWLTVVVGCAYSYAPLGEMLAQHTLLSRLTCFIVVYIGLAGGILVLFGVLKRRIGGKLVGSDIFGRGEYYLGMVGGVLHFACVALVALSLLNARAYTSQEAQAQERAQVDTLGKTYFPPLPSIQATVFQESLCGPWIKGQLSSLLIHPTHLDKKELHVQEFQIP